MSGIPQDGGINSGGVPPSLNPVAPRKPLPPIPQKVVGQPSAKQLSPVEPEQKRVGDVAKQQVEVKRETDASPTHVALTAAGTEYKQKGDSLLIPIDSEGSVEEESSTENVAVPPQPNKARVDADRINQESWTPEGSAQTQRPVEVREVKSSEGRFEGVGKALGNLIGRIINSGPVQGLFKLVSAAKEHLSSLFASKDPQLEKGNIFIKRIVNDFNIPVHEEETDKAVAWLKPGQGIVVKEKDKYMLAEKNEQGEVKFIDLASIKDPGTLLYGLNDVRQKNEAVEKELAASEKEKAASSNKQRQADLQAEVRALRAKPREPKDGEKARSINLGPTIPRSQRAADEQAQLTSIPEQSKPEASATSKADTAPTVKKEPRDKIKDITPGLLQKEGIESLTDVGQVVSFIQKDMKTNERAQVYRHNDRYYIASWKTDEPNVFGGFKPPEISIWAAPPNATLEFVKERAKRQKLDLG